MSHVSKQSATKVQQLPPYTEHTDDLDDYTVNFVTLNVDVDLAPLLKGLPDDRCQCPHWGYQFKGTQTVTYANHEEVIEAGSAFYMPPGHTPQASAGSEFVVFSPSAELKISEEAMARNAQALQQG